MNFTIMAKILIIDDQKAIRSSLKEVLELEEYAILEAENGKKGLSIIHSDPVQLVYLDIKMDGMDGIEVLQEIQNMESAPVVIMMSGHGDIETAVECLKKGAFDYLEKPLDLNRVLISARNALNQDNLIRENTVLKKSIVRQGNHQMIGKSGHMKEIEEMISKVAPTPSRVLILGENGTGKELVARAIHTASGLPKDMFIEVNCAAIPGELIESELFGHEKGSFTGAQKLKKGKFELASKGTLFLDEIGDMSLSAQAKVLRALQEGEISRVGGEKVIKVAPRVLAATNKNLMEAIKQGEFREDLYHRISTIIIKVPNLNERQDDIPVLVEFFNEIISKELGIKKKAFSEGAIKALTNIHWTGNIRELRNMVERLLILCDQEILDQDVKKFANPK